MNLTWLKQEARRIGYVTNPSDAVEQFKLFYKKNGLVESKFHGKIWEVAVMFILGIMQQSIHERNISMNVTCTNYLDNNQVDVQINNYNIQLKLFYSQLDVETLQDVLRFRGITVVNAAKSDDGIEVFRRILEASAYTKAEIESEIDINPGFDAAEDIYYWLIEHVFIT